MIMSMESVRPEDVGGTRECRRIPCVQVNDAWSQPKTILFATLKHTHVCSSKFIKRMAW
jgi:hypothetical protein